MRRPLPPLLAATAAVAAAILLLALQAAATQAPELDVEVEILRVVDGDTVVAVVKEALRSEYKWLQGERVRVRLADINAPEKGTPEGEAATERLKEILAEAQRYYLDIDDKYVTDRYDRIVAILYAEVDGTLVNVNAKLVLEGHAYIWDHDNEFNPQTWTATETPKPGATGSQPETAPAGGDQEEGALAIAAASIIAVLLIAAAAALRRIKG